jgi:hypothetical protein
VAIELAASRALPSRCAAVPAWGYERRRPEETTLHAVVREQLESFLVRAREGDHPAPRFVEQELRAYPQYGSA